jgi:hypothetical protein
VEGSCEQGNELAGTVNIGYFLSSCVTGAFSRRAQLHVVSLSVSLLVSQNNSGIQMIYFRNQETVEVDSQKTPFLKRTKVTLI